MKGRRHQVVRFALIGIASTALYFGLLIVLEPVLPSIIVLTAISYAVAMVFNFLAQGLLTFQLQSLTIRQMCRYVVMHGSALVVNSLAMAALVDGFGANIFIAQIFVTAGVTMATFVLSRNWVYI